MKKNILTAILTSMALSMTVPVTAYAGTVATQLTAIATPTFDSTNTASVGGVITKIKKTKKKGRKISVVLFGGAYEGHRYSIKLSKLEWKDWNAEQGKIHTGDGVVCWMYNNGTADVSDDIILNIHK